MMLHWFELVLMAIVQGVTEFLPVSSSGHLTVLGHLFGLDADKSLSVSIFLHAGSLLAIIVFYFKLLLGFLKKEQFHLLLMIFCASIPAAVAGVTFKAAGGGETLLGSPVVTGMAFLVTGMLLRLTGKPKLLPPEEETVALKEITFRQAVTIGLVQMVALLPGISRSGSTISAALFCGVKREDAAAFSFLLAIPAVAGATCFEVVELLRQTSSGNADVSLPQIIAAVVLSFLVSLGALHLMVNVVKKSRLSAFSWYLFILGAGVLIWQFLLLNGAR